MNEFVNVGAYLDEIKGYMPHYVFYRRGFGAPELVGFGDYCESYRNSKLTDCYCTACNTRYEDNINKPSAYKHKDIGKCARCGAVVERRAMGRGRATLRETMNFAVFEGAGNIMRISCITAELTFKNDELEPQYEWWEITRYQLEPQKAVQYRQVFDSFEQNYTFIPKKRKPSEPNFARGGFYCDSSYTLVNREALSNSFLKYIDAEWDSENLPTLFIEWLCRYSEHPQIEYFLHGGLHWIAEEIVHRRGLHGIRFNWKSNDLKKILRISKPELAYLQEVDGYNYAEYIRFRRNIYHGNNPHETIRYHRAFYNSAELIQNIRKITGLSAKRIMDYSLKKQNKQGGYFFLTCWRDYLDNCNKLEYDMKNEALIMPKDLWKEHDKVMKLFKLREDEILAKRMAQLVEERREIEVMDMELGFLIRQPYSVKEIVAEGKALDHCVGGYAERHAEGITTIMFIRRISEPMEPFYTMEVSRDLEIKQCYGYKNNRYHKKTEDIILFEERYQEYLDVIKAKRRAEAKKAKRKKRERQKANATA